MELLKVDLHSTLFVFCHCGCVTCLLAHVPVPAQPLAESCGSGQHFMVWAPCFSISLSSTLWERMGWDLGMTWTSIKLSILWTGISTKLTLESQTLRASPICYWWKTVLFDVQLSTNMCRISFSRNSDGEFWFPPSMPFNIMSQLRSFPYKPELLCFVLLMKTCFFFF